MSYSIEITENITSVDVSENITTVNITPTTTEVEVRGISIAQSNASGISTTHDSDSFLAGYGTVQSSFDRIGTGVLTFKADVGGTDFFKPLVETFSITGSTGITTEIKNQGNPELYIKITDILPVNSLSLGSASAVPTFTINKQGQVITGQDVNIEISKSQVTDLTTQLASLSAAIVANSTIDSTMSATAAARANSVSATAAANITTNANNLSSLTGRVDTISSKVTTNTAGLTSANSRIDTVSSAALANQNSIVSANSRIDTVSSVALANQNSIVSANSRIDTVSSVALANQNSILTNSAAIVSANSRIDTVSSNVATNTANIANKFDKVGGTISGDVTITGDLTVSGSTVQLNAEVLNVEDNTIFLNNTNSAITSNCAGLAVFRGTGVDNAEFIFNNTTSSWSLTNYVQLDKVLDSSGSTGSADQFLSRSSDGATKWATVVTDTSALDARIDTVSSVALANQNAILTNSAGIVSANSRIDTVSSVALANQNSILTNSAGIVSANSRIDTVSSVALANQNSIVSANSRINTVSSVALANQNAIVSANSRIDTNSAAIAALSTANVLIDVKNTHTDTVTKGTPVYVTGSVGASGRVEVQPADSSSSSTMPAVGLLAQDLAQNGEGQVVVTGILSHFNTNSIDGATAGDDNDSGKTIYVKSGGGLTVTRPTSSSVLVQNMGKVGRDHDSTGNLIVSSIMRSNDVPNLADGDFWIGNSGATPTSFSSVLQSKLSQGSFSAELTALRGRAEGQGGFGIVNMISMSALNLTIGEKTTSIEDIHVHPGTVGSTFLHYGNAEAAGNPETQRLHTTNTGIHVGDNLGGTYTAGDQQENFDTGFGFAVGQDITNYGHNCTLFGQAHDISVCSLNVYGLGYEVETVNNVKNVFGVGEHIKFTGFSGQNVYKSGMFGFGRYVEVTGNYSFAAGNGIASSRVKASGLTSFAFGREAQATGDYSFAQGNTVELEGTWYKPTSSRENSVTFGPNTNGGVRSFVTGGGNQITSVTNYYHFVAGYRNIINNSSNYCSLLGVKNQIQNGVNYAFAAGRENILKVDADYSGAIGRENTLYGGHSFAAGFGNETVNALGQVALGRGLKTPLRDIPGSYPAQGDGQIVVGAYNKPTREYASGTGGAHYTYDIVAPLHFCVGTGTDSASGAYTSLAVGPRSISTSSEAAAGFSGIMIDALLDSPQYSTENAAKTGGVPKGGLYRDTSNNIKIRTID